MKNRNKEKALFNPRPYMELSINEMNKSKNEPRPDGKIPPKVGAVLVFPDGEVFQAHRGELRDGDHAEYTLIERKLASKKLDGCILFTTLEPCVERNAPKVACCRRTTNARIKKVYVGIEDPDPTVSGKGIKHLECHGVEVKMFDADLQRRIKKENVDFLRQAVERKLRVEDIIADLPLEKPVLKASLDDLSNEALQKFINDAKLDYKINTSEFTNYLLHLGILTLENGIYVPNGYGFLLFGKNPRLKFKQVAFKCTANFNDYDMAPAGFDQALVFIPDLVEEWLKKTLGQIKDTSSFRRKEIPMFPVEVLREAVINAIVHRDYSIEEAKNLISIDNDSIVIKSPGAPLPAISIEQLNSFKAPSLSRNPIITYVFNLMNYVEESGFGMSAFRSLNEKYDLPLPEYSYENPFLTLTFARNLESVKRVSNVKGIEELNEVQLKGYEWLKRVGEASTREYSAHFRIGYKTAQRHLSRMKELALIGDNDEDSNSPNYKHRAINLDKNLDNVSELQ